MTSETLPVHEVAKLMPAMTPDEYSDLVADIRRNGQLEPIWTYQGAIIDGRHRYRACRDLGYKPRVEEWNGSGSLIELVVSKNLRRRHLTPTQRALLAEQIRPRLAEEARVRMLRGKASEPTEDEDPSANWREGKAAQQAAEITGSSPRQVERVHSVTERAPELESLMADATLTAHAASAIAELPADERREIVDSIRQSPDPKAASRDQARRARERQEAEDLEATNRALQSGVIRDTAKAKIDASRQCRKFHKTMDGLLEATRGLPPATVVSVMEEADYSWMDNSLLRIRAWADAMDEAMRESREHPFRLIVGGAEHESA